MFKSVQKNAKKSGKGVRHSSPVITDEDMEKLAYYFSTDHCNDFKHPSCSKTPYPNLEHGFLQKTLTFM